MARIALVVKKYRPTVASLVQTLRAQQNTVLLITDKITAQSLPPLDCEVIAPFQNWNAREALVLFPRLFSRPPDILHFVFSEPSEQPTIADWIFAQLMQPFPGKVVAATFFYSPREVSSWRLRRFLSGCHAITWGSHTHLLQAKRDHNLPKKSLVEVLPPMSSQDDLSSENAQIEVRRLVDSLAPFLLVPGSSSDFLQNADPTELFFDRNINFLFLSERRKSQKVFRNYYYLNSDSRADIALAMEKSMGVLLAFSELSLMELQNYHHWSKRFRTPLLVNPRQNTEFTGLVLQGRTGWVLQDREASLRNLLREFPELKRPSKLDEHPNYELGDATGNQLSRLFNQALSLRS